MLLLHFLWQANLLIYLFILSLSLSVLIQKQKTAYIYSISEKSIEKILILSYRFW